DRAFARAVGPAETADGRVSAARYGAVGARLRCARSRASAAQSHAGWSRVTSPFFALDIANRALRTQQLLVDITNQNIANANTPGYSRQEAVVKETLPYPIPVFHQSGEPGQLGTGVEIAEVNRSRDTFADYQ